MPGLPAARARRPYQTTLPASRGEVAPSRLAADRVSVGFARLVSWRSRAGVAGRRRRPPGRGRRGRPRRPAGIRSRPRRLPAPPPGAAARAARTAALARLGPPATSSRPSAPAAIDVPVAAPGGRRRGRPRRAARRPLDRHRVGQVAGLPAARADRDPRAPGRPRRARRDHALHQPHQGARPGPARRRRRRSGSACGSPPTTATRRSTSATGPASTGSTSSPTPTCSTARSCRGTTGGRAVPVARPVVVDECHHYRGVFGAHVAQVLRRLRRVCAHHGSDPTFVLASATVGNPAEHASPGSPGST